MFLHFSTISLVQVELFFTDRLLAFFKINRIDVIDSNKPKQENTDISCIDTKLFNYWISIIHEASLIDRYTILRILVFFYEAHWLEYFIKHDVINLVMDR